jgi:exopolysaccharide biosynthesis polyprenyl glycosylphosphotransferase
LRFRFASRAERLLILGTSPLAVELIEAIRQCSAGHLRVLGMVGEGGAGVPGCPWLGSLAQLPHLLDALAPDRIVVAMEERRRRLPTSQLVEARIRRRIVVESAEDLYERLSGKLALHSLMPSRFIFSQEFRPSRFALAAGRVLSLLTAAVGLIALAPLLALIIVALKLDSPGPVLFVQERVGLGGRRFKLWKFRTMHPAGAGRSEWERDNADRITRVGRWLRQFRLDELPQFVNILRGEMNLVGPRPHPASNLELFTLVSRNTPDCGGQIPYYSLRMLVRPGITGWAQVRYRYANDLDEEMEKLRYDLYYIKHLSLRLDLRILLETIRVVVRGRGHAAERVPAAVRAGAAVAANRTPRRSSMPSALLSEVEIPKESRHELLR